MADVTRVYEIQVAGVNQAGQQLVNFTKQIADLDSQWKQFKEQLGAAQAANDNKSIEELTKKITALEKQIEELTKAKEAYVKETVLQAKAENDSRIASEASAKASANNVKATSSQTKATKDQTSANEDEEQSYKTLAERISQLKRLREENQQTGKPIVFEEVPLSRDQSLTVLQSFLALQNQIKQEEQSMDSAVKAKNATLQKGVSLLEIQRRELALIVSATAKGDDVFFRGKILSYEEANTKLSTLLRTEELYKKQQIELSASIDTTTFEITELTARQEQLNAAIAKGKSTNIAPFSPQIGVDFEGQNTTLRVAEQINEQINRELLERNQILVTLKTTQSNMLQNEIDEEAIRRASVAAEQGSLNDLIAKRKQLNDLISRVAENSGTKIPFDDDKITVEQAIIKREELNTKIDEERKRLGLITDKQKEEISAYDSLIAKRKELNNLILSADVSGKQIVTFESQDLSIDKAIAKRVVLDEQIEKAKRSALSENEILKTQISEYDQLIARRKELINLTNSASLAGESTVTFEKNTISIEAATRKIQEMNVRTNELNDRFKVQKNLHDEINIAESTSITKLKEEAALLQTILANRSEKATTVTFQGSTLGIEFAQKTLAQYQATIKEYTDAEKLRAQAINITSDSMKSLEIETKTLTQANGLLTASNKEVGLSLTQLQWDKIKSQIIGIAPELQSLSLAEVNAGKASEILTQKIFENNAALRDYKRSISGSNTLVGDYTKGIVDAFKNMGLGGIIAKQKGDVDNEIKQLVIRINDLTKEWSDAFKNGKSGLDVIEKELQDTIVLHTKLTSNVKTLNNAFENTADVGKQISNGLSLGFDKLNSNIGRTLVTYFGFQQAISGISNLVTIDKTLTDQFADLQRVLGATADETKGVITQLKELDTRTSLTELQGFAIIAARAGVAEENIAGVTSAINKLQLIAGHELGDIDQATTSIVKLINIFQGAGAVTEQAVLRTGNALVKLANEGVASGQFLIGFSERLAGIRGSTGIAQEAVLGLAAAFEETGQAQEVAATAVSQVLNKISQDVPKYAALAGKAVEEFRTTLRENPAEALIQLSEALTGGGKAADEMGEAFSELGLTGVRIRSTLQDVGANADFFRKRIADATNALLDQSSIIEGSAAKQRNFAATIEKVSAEFTKIANNDDFLNLLENISSLVLSVVRGLTSIPFGFIITGIAGLTSALALFKGQAIATALAQASLNKESALYRVGLLAERLGLVSTTAAQRFKAAALAQERQEQRDVAIARIRATSATAAEAEATIAATIATEGLNTAFKVSPIGIFLALLGLILPIYASYASKTKDATEALLDQNDATKGVIDIQKELHGSMQAETGKTKTQIANLIDIIKDETLNLNTRKVAYETLIKLQPEFTGTVEFTTDALGKEQIQIKNLMATYDDFIIKLDEVSKARATQTLNAKAQEDLQTSNFAIFAAKQEKSAAEEAKRQLNIQQNLYAQYTTLRNKAIKEGTDPNKVALPQGLDPNFAKTSQSAFTKAGERIKQADEAIKKAIANQGVALSSANKVTAFVKSEVDNYNTQLEDINKKLKNTNLKADDRLALIKEQNRIQGLINASLGITPKGESVDVQYYIDLYNTTAEQIRQLDKNIAQLDKQDVRFKEQNKKIIELRKQQRETARRIKELGGVVPGTDASTRTPATGRVQVERDILNEIETLRNRDVALENLRVAKITQVRKLDEREEEEHLRNLQEINDKYDNEKISRLEEVLNTTIKMQEGASGKLAQKLNSDRIREEKELSEAQLATAKRQQDTNEQINALRQKELTEQARVEKRDLDLRKADLQKDFEDLANVPNQSAAKIAEAQKKLHNDMLVEVSSHYSRLIDLARKYNISTETLEDEKNRAISDILKAALNDEKDIYDAFFKDVEKKTSDNILGIRDKLNTIREGVLSSKANPQTQTFELGLVSNAEEVLKATEALTGAQDEYNKALEEYNKINDDTRDPNKAIFVTKQQVQALHDAVVLAKTDLKAAIDVLNEGINNYSNAASSITSRIGNLFKNVFKISEKDLLDPAAMAKKQAQAQLLGETVSQAFSLASDAMNSYFDQEQARIEASNKAMDERLELEFSQRKARAQSQAEENTIERELAQAKKNEDKKAFEANKKLQIEQAKINLGMQLSNLALIATAPTPANIFSLGLAGQIMFGIQAILAFTRYISSVSRIQSAQFVGEYGMHLLANGGSPDTTTTRGGRVKGRPHSAGGNPFIFKGRIFEDEVDELNVIRTKNVPKNTKYRVEGTQSQIASFLNKVGGGIDFHSGAIGKRLEFGGTINNINKFESGGGVLSLNAPRNTTEFLNGNNTSIDIKKVADAFYSDLKDTNERINAQTDNLNTLAEQTNTRIDNIKVTVVAKEVEDTNKRIKKASSVGTLG